MGRISVEDQPSAAERVVQRQYDAYNRHDVEAFVAVGIFVWEVRDGLITTITAIR
jgi:hypothetical protein